MLYSAPVLGGDSAKESQTLAALFGIPDPAVAGLPSHHRPMQERAVVFAVDIKLSDLPVGVSTDYMVNFSGGVVTTSAPENAISCSVWGRNGDKNSRPAGRSDGSVAILDHVRVTAVCWNVMPTPDRQLEPTIKLVLLTSDNRGITCTNIKPSTTVNALTDTFGPQNLNLNVTESSGMNWKTGVGRPVGANWQPASKTSARKMMRDIPTEMEPSVDEITQPLPAAHLPEVRGRDREHDFFTPSSVDENKK